MIDKLTKPKLIEACEAFAVAYEAEYSKLQLRDALSHAGVTDVMYRKEFGIEEPTPVQQERSVLIRMTRNNPTYETRGYRFTRTHPFVLVAPGDVDYLVEIETGFRIASPNEVDTYYG